MDTHASRRSAGKTSPTPGGAAGVDPAEFAEYLRAERERRRLTLDQIAGETKIAQRHLAALERGDVRNWPGGMYRRAMMRAYAESIGVDREFALQQFERAFDQPAAAHETPAERGERAPQSRRWRLSRMLVIAAAAGVGLAIGVGLWQVAGEDRPAPAGAGGVDLRAGTAAAVTPAVETTRVEEPRTGEGPTATSGTASEEPAARPLASEGNLTVQSNPPGARVTVNGIGWGETPVTIRHLPLGEKRVRLTMQGYMSQETVVHLGAGRPNANVRLTLREREPIAKESEGKEPETLK